MADCCTRRCGVEEALATWWVNQPAAQAEDLGYRTTTLRGLYSTRPRKLSSAGLLCLGLSRKPLDDVMIVKWWFTEEGRESPIMHGGDASPALLAKHLF